MKATQFRLDDIDRERIVRIRNHFRLPSEAAAVRYALGLVDSQIVPEEPEGKSRKKSKKGD